MKSNKIPCINQADLESLIKRIDNCKNNLKKSLTRKIGEYILCGYSMSAIWSFDKIDNKHSLYLGED